MIHSGIGGVIVLSSTISCILFGSLPSLLTSGLPSRVRGLDVVGRLSLRILFRDRMLCRGVMICPALGEAVTTVPGVAAGGGVGESDRNKGWMCSSLVDGCSVNVVRTLLMDEAGLKLWLRGRRGGSQSAVLAGLGVRLARGLAGMVSKKPDLPKGGDDASSTVCRLCASTDEVSQQSKASSPLVRQAFESNDAGRRFSLSDNNLVLDVMGRIACDREELTEVIVPALDRPPMEEAGLR